MTENNQKFDNRPGQTLTHASGASQGVSNQRADFQTAEVHRYTKPTMSHGQAGSIEETHAAKAMSASTEQIAHRSDPPYYQSREGQSNTGSNGTSNPNAELPRQAEMQNPTTVDPSQIFNHYEYQRRQASAEAARKAAEEAAARKAEATKRAVIAEPVDAPAAEADSSASRKDQMELEMKQMIEKMRDYKAKDPTLFSQIWEQVKKVLS
jgi:hypothetical protein